jgi:hypothetical protein
MVPIPVAYVSNVQPLTGVTIVPYCEHRARVASTKIKHLAYEKSRYFDPVAFWGVINGAYC